MESTYRINVYRSFYNERLKSHWLALQEKADCFPQLYYEWCEPWWKYRSGGRRLHIVTVLDENNIIVAIAPLCIEAKPGVKIIRSFPIHFGDFYTFVADKQNHNTIVSLIIKYLLSFRHWDLIRLSKINDQDLLYSILNSYFAHKKKLTRIHVTDFSLHSPEKDILMMVSQKTRSEYRRRLKRISEIGKVSLNVIENYKDYSLFFENMRSIYEKRWNYDKIKPPSDNYYSMQNEAIKGLFDKNKVIIFLLKLNTLVIAYRWGFIHQDTYYDWRVSHDPKFDKYFPGIMLLGLSLQESINRGIKKINFGAGDYDWKKRWASTNIEIFNYEFFISTNLSLSRIYITYYTRWRNKIKRLYNKLLNYSFFRYINRIIRAPK